MPSGRGAGSLADDLYALGVLIAVLLSGGNPCAEMSDEEIVQSKINRGSFATLLSSRRFSLPCTEALRGLLCDEAEERWSVSNLEFWANGRHLSPKQPLLPSKAPRPFVVKGRDYWNLKVLGAALGRDWSTAREVLVGTKLPVWVHRGLEAEKHAERIRAAMGAWPRVMAGVPARRWPIWRSTTSAPRFVRPSRP